MNYNFVIKSIEKNGENIFIKLSYFSYSTVRTMLIFLINLYIFHFAHRLGKPL